MKRHWKWLAGLVGVWGVLAAAGPAAAQGLYRPAKPTLSPWLNLYNQNPGPLDNYHQYVRPEMELQNTLRQNEARLRFQAQGSRRWERQSPRVGNRKGSVRPARQACS